MIVKQFRPFVGMEEYEAIKECFENNWITEGPKAKEFSDKLCDLIGCKYGVFANNGTLSIYLGLRAMGVGPGDEVIVPDFTFIASANAVEMTGATPVFADIEVNTLHLDLDHCETLVNEKTKAIMPVHIYGMSANMTKIMNFANKHNLMVIEDAAQAIGVNWNGQHCGTFGEIGSFSFFADKTITTAEGGFVCTNDEEIYHNLLYLRNQGRLNRGTFKHPRIGYNFRITDIHAAIGLAQLSKLDLIKSKKINNLTLFEDRLKGVNGLKIIKPELGSNHVPFRVAILFDQKKDKIEEFLSTNGIETRTFFYPLHKQPCYPNQKLLSNSSYVYDHGLCMPSYPELTVEEIDYVCNKIKQFLVEA
jgi:perosamine synthetase